MEKYPSFKLVLDFVRDPAWVKERVEQLLKERAQHAKCVAEVYLFATEFIKTLADDNIFQVEKDVVIGVNDIMIGAYTF